MPIYEFVCKSCQKTNEVLMKISDPAPDACIYCSKGPLEKRMSRTSFVLKGQGWYETDFKAKSTPASQGPTSPPLQAAPAGEAAPASVPEAPALVEAPKSEPTKSESTKSESRL